MGHGKGIGVVGANAYPQFDLAVPGTVHFVYGAVAWVVNNGNYHHVEPQPHLKTISFCTGGSTVAWGRRWVVRVAGADGQAHVTVNITRRNCIQRLDAVRTAKMVNEFHRKIMRAVSAAA